MYEIEIQKKLHIIKIQQTAAVYHVFAVTKDEENLYFLYLSCTNSGLTSQLVKYRWVP